MAADFETLTPNEQLAIVNGKLKALETERLNVQLRVVEAGALEQNHADDDTRIAGLDARIGAIRSTLRDPLVKAGADDAGIAVSPGALRRAERGLPA